MVDKPPYDEDPTLLVVGSADPMIDGLCQAVRRHRTSVEQCEKEHAVSAALAAAPDLILAVGDAIADDGAEILRKLSAHPGVAVIPVALLLEEPGLDVRLTAFRHGAVAVVPKSASLDHMARQISKLAASSPDFPGEVEGEIGEATVDELVDILGKELRAGILSVSHDRNPASESARGARFVLKSGRSVEHAIRDFVRRIRPLLSEAKPLRFHFDEALSSRLAILDDEATRDDFSVLRDRRILVLESNPADADAIAQGLRYHGAQVVVAGEGDGGLDRARQLDPEVVLIERSGVESWGYATLRRIRTDPRLRWASVLVLDREELWTRAGALQIDRLAGAVGPLVRIDQEIRGRAKHEQEIDIRLDAVGPTRLLRALAAPGHTFHVTVRHPRAIVEVDLAAGMIAGAEAVRMDDASARLTGSTALAALCALGSGRVTARRQEHPTSANLLVPIDEAFARAAREKPPIQPSIPPPAHLPQTTASRRPSSMPPHPAVPDDLVRELKSLVTELRATLPPSLSQPPTPSVPAPQLPGEPGVPGELGAALAAPPPPGPLRTEIIPPVETEEPALVLEPWATPKFELRSPRSKRRVVAICGAVFAMLCVVGIVAALDKPSDIQVTTPLAKARAKRSKPTLHAANNDSDTRERAAREPPAPTLPTAAPQDTAVNDSEANDSILLDGTSETTGDVPIEMEEHELIDNATSPDALPTDLSPSDARSPDNEHGPIDATLRYLRLGNYMRAHKKYALAESYYLKVIARNPQSGRALAGLARTHLARGHSREAVRWARKLIRARPRNSANYVLLGDAFARGGKREAARKVWLKARKLNPQSSAVRKRLAAQR